MKYLVEIVRKSWHSDYVEMTEEEFEKLDNALSTGSRSERKEAEEKLASLVPPTSGNWQDDEFVDVGAFEPAELEEQEPE